MWPAIKAILKSMPDTRRAPAIPPLDYDPEVRDKIEDLLNELRATNDPAVRERICDELDALIFHGD